MILLSAALMFSCTADTSLKITGNVEGDKNGKEVFLFKNGSPADTAVVANGAFSFTVDAATPSIIQINQDRTSAIVFAEPGEVNVSLGKTSTAKGNALTDALAVYNGDLAALYTKYQAKMKELQEQFKDDEKALNNARSEYYSNEYLPAVKKLSTTLFEANKTNVLGAYIYLQANSNPTVAKIDEFMQANPVAKQYTQIVKEREVLVNREKTAVGMMFTDIVGQKMDKSGVAKLSDYVGKGNYVLVDFWATWCGPCKREIPYIQEVYKKYAKKGLIVLGINVWDQYEPAVKTVKEFDMTWDHIYASDDRTATTTYGIKGIPTLILFGPDGKIVDRTFRGANMVKAIDEIYAK